MTMRKKTRLAREGRTLHSFWRSALRMDSSVRLSGSGDMASLGGRGAAAAEDGGGR